MTDRIKGLTVTLKPNIREDDAQAIIDAISMVKGVVAIDKHVADIDHHMAVTTAKHNLSMKLHEVWRALIEGKEIKIVEES